MIITLFLFSNSKRSHNWVKWYDYLPACFVQCSFTLYNLCYVFVETFMPLFLTFLIGPPRLLVNRHFFFPKLWRIFICDIVIYCKPTLIRVWENLVNFVIAKISLCEPNITCNTWVTNMASLQKLLTAIHFTTEESQNKEAANKSWFTLCMTWMNK